MPLGENILPARGLGLDLAGIVMLRTPFESCDTATEAFHAFAL